MSPTIWARGNRLRRVHWRLLRKLRLDAKMQFKIPEDMTLQVFLEILAYSSEDNFVESGCVQPGEKVEVRIGAEDVSVEWISECKIDLGVKLSLKDRDGDGGLPPLPIGVGGSFELADGAIDFETFEILEFGATMAVGAEECYLGAKARAIFSSYEVAAGLFFGRTCTLEPILFVDPTSVMRRWRRQFHRRLCLRRGLAADLGLVLGVPASCMFRIDAGRHRRLLRPGRPQRYRRERYCRRWQSLPRRIR